MPFINPYNIFKNLCVGAIWPPAHHTSLIGIVTTAALVFKHQALSICNADLTFIAPHQIHTDIYDLLQRTQQIKIIIVTNNQLFNCLSVFMLAIFNI